MKKGILVVSFGTSYKWTRKLCIESIEDRIRERFKDFEVRRAFTSKIVMKKLKIRDGIYVDNVDEALEKFKKDDFDEVYVQSLHIIPGSEYEKICEAVEMFKSKNSFPLIKIGKPLLNDDKDYEKVIEGLKSQMPVLKDDEAIVFMGHGSEHASDVCYSILQKEFIERGMERVHIGTVEGSKTLEDIIPLLKNDGITKVTLIPFMLVAGDHAINDMASDEDDSWKSILKREGFEVDTYIHGLGENKKIQDIFIEHLKEIIY